MRHHGFVISAVAALLTAGTCATAQVAAGANGFDAASIKVNASGAVMRLQSDPGRLRFQAADLRTRLRLAYGMRETQISGPAWLASDHYDLIATTPAPTPVEQMMVSLQSRLAKRFQLVVHFETQERPVYLLMATENKLTAKAPTAFKAWSWPGGAHVEGSGSLAQFADALSRLTDRPIIDESGSSGDYELKLEWSPQQDRAPVGVVADGATRMQAPAGAKAATMRTTGTEASAMPTLFTALSEQLGLKLEAQRRPLRVLVVDHAERIPSGN